MLKVSCCMTIPTSAIEIFSAASQIAASHAKPKIIFQIALSTMGH
jgi:hypothetical protein